MDIMKKRILTVAASVVIGMLNIGTANAVDVTTWGELNTNENIMLTSDILAEGEPQTIQINSGSTPQIIDGGKNSLIGAAGYNVQVNNNSEFTVQNFGKVVDGTEDNHTYSYIDLSGNAVYKTITGSINGFNLQPIQTNNINLLKYTVDNVIYKNNTGQLLSVWLKDSTDNASIKNTVFYGNTLNSGTITGKAMLTISRGTVDIDNLIVDSNIGKGADSILDFSSVSYTKINNSIFQNNKTSELGTLQLSGGNVEINNSQFINNKMDYDGGSISVTSGLKSITNSIFKNNTAKYGAGGAIWFAQLSSSPYFINTTFEGNKAVNDAGGAIFIGGTSASTATAYIIDSEFKNNEASYGGGLYTYRSIDFYVVDTVFTNNKANEGGAIYAERENLNIFANTKDVTFSGNIATNTTDTYNGGAAVYYDVRNLTNVAFNINAANNKKVIFDNSIAAYGTGVDVNMNINKSGLSYIDIEGNTVKITNLGEIQFNDKVGDEENNIFNINLYGGTLSIGQNAHLNASIANPDGYINDNNFYVKGDSILNTVNNVIGEFAPKVFEIDNGVTLDYQFDVDLANEKSDTISVTSNNGTFRLSSFNVISDADTEGLKIKYSGTNINGTVKEDYSITTSQKTYDVIAENDNDGSYIVFSATEAGGGLPAAIANASNQYVITNNQDENVTAWIGDNGNVVTKDIDINANGHSIYTENGLDGVVVSDGISAVMRNIKTLSGFNNPLTNNGGNLIIVDSNIKDNTGSADITNNSGSVVIDAATTNISIGSENTENALISNGGFIEVKGSNKVTFNGDVKGSNNAKMSVSTDTNFNGDVSDMNIEQTSGTVDVNNVSGAVFTLNNGTLNLNESGSFAPDTFELINGTINIANETGFSPKSNILSGGNINAINGKTGNLNFNSLTLRNAINLAVDIDLKKQVMDTISASSVKGNGIIKINEFNVLSDSNKAKFSIPFADGKLKDRVSTDIKTLEGKIYKYNIAYDSKTGQFNIIGGGNNSDGYSPSVMASPIAAQLQGYLTQLNSYDEAFRNMDMYMLLPSSVRQAMKHKNQVAISTSATVYNSDKTIYDDNTAWVRTHTTFEKVPLKNGPKVGNIAYGTYFGGESELYGLGYGWDGMWGLYAGYNGSHQNYNGVSMYQNGGTLGILGMAYKGNFFQGLTINTGANGGEASTRYGNEDFAMLMAGVASKTGYNIELSEGKFIIQPSLLLSYSFVNSFDYTNSEGIGISSDPLHAIQVEPNLKFIANLKNGWQPYASAGIVWSIMDKTHYMANEVSLPELSVKPYVKYGVGIRKSWGERFTGFFQTYITNGGRNGVGLQLGFRWALGSNKPDTKVLNETKTLTEKKNIKTLSSHSAKGKKCIISRVNY